jgi:beta-1,4-mannosyltransferase
MPLLRVAFAPSRAGGNPYLDDLAAALPGDRISEVRASWRDLAGPGGARLADVVHVHWVQMLVEEQGVGFGGHGAAVYLRRLLRLRQHGVAVVWTMHNLASHEQGAPGVDRTLRRATAATAARVVVHCEVARQAVRRLWPRARTVVLPHPARELPPMSREQARARLGLDNAARVIAVPGAIRGYKDVPGLLHALRECAGGEVRVVVAGQPRDNALAGAVRHAAGGDTRVLLRLERQDDDDLRAVMAAADVAVLPYRRVLTSGAAIATLAEGTPVVVPALGCLVEQAGPGALVHRAGDLATAARLAVDTPLEELRRRGEAGRGHVLRTTWAVAGARMAEVYEQAAGRAPG